jgi:hypothetical protein
MRNIRHLYGRLVPRTLTWSFCVKTEVKLASLLLRVVPLVFGQLSVSLVKVVWGFARNVRRILRGSGERGLATYLKTCYVLTQHIAGGQKASSPWALGGNVSRTRRGLPRIINPQHRTFILKGEIPYIRLWLTLFGLYRVIEFKGRLKLSTITNPGVDLSAFMGRWEAWVPRFYSRARLITGSKWDLDVTRHLTIKSIPFIRKSSPNSGGMGALVALPLDLLLWMSCPSHYPALVSWLKLIDELDFLWAVQGIRKCYLRMALKAVDSKSREELERHLPPVPAQYAVGPQGQLSSFIPERGEASEEDLLFAYASMRWGKPLWFGKLGFKHEPGKIRVFAMMNLITQTLMHPLHSWIFRHLRLFSTDGTFDQVRPINNLLKRIDRAQFWIASYDLSAATDRLPIELQVSLLRPLLGDKLTGLWAYFMVGHGYGLPKIAKSYNLKSYILWYAVGQPMGALSSWAMLALTHHAIVQYAASLAYSTTKWFDLYAVLGDDVVIADRSVAARYLEIMKEIGVDISAAKSMVSSSGSFEFAKRTWISGRQATPISLAELLVALCHLGALEQLVRKCIAVVPLTMAAVARFAGFGFKNLGRLPVVFSLANRQGRLFSYLTRPGGVWPMPIEAWLTALGPGRESRIQTEGSWATAQALWSRLAESIISRAGRFARTLGEASTALYPDLTVKSRRKDGDKIKGSGSGPTATSSRRSPWGVGVREIVGLDDHRDLWSSFFETWVAYPFTERLRKSFSRVDERLQVLHPNNTPDWALLDELWSEIFETEESLSALPSTIDYLDRETDEVAVSTRLISLWVRLRRVAARRATTLPAHPRPELPVLGRRRPMV